MEERTEKEVYEAPELRELGTVAEFTQDDSGGSIDNAQQIN
jgi:hypothetical protein